MKISDVAICHGTKRPKPVFSVDVSRTNIVTSSLDGEIGIWSNAYEHIRTIRKHSGAVLCVRFNANGSLIASGGDDGVVFVYRINGEVVASAHEHESDVSNVMWTNKFLVSVGYDGYVVLYDLESFAVVRKTKSHEGQIKGISADGSFRYMCTQGEDGIVLYEDFEVVGRKEASKGIILESFFSRISWSPDGRYFASGLSFNAKHDTVEIFDRDMKNECSLVGHVAPCEAVMFSPNLYGRDRRHYVLAVSSQDLSLSFWSSVSPRPFLLVKNLTELPVLDMRWSADGNSLFMCSYGGEIRRIDVEPDDFGETFNEELEDTRNDIFFSVENMEMFKRMEDGLSEDKEDSVRRKKKVVRPVLLDSDEGSGVGINTGHSYLAILNHKRKMVGKTETSPFVKTFGDFRVELNGDRTCVSVSRGSREHYRIHRNIEIMCLSKKHICLYTGRIELYYLRTGVLLIPFIYSDDVATMDVLGSRLVYLQIDGTFTVFSLRLCRVLIQGRLPRCDNLMSLRLSRKHFMIATFANEECFLARKLGVWVLKTPKYNSISSRDANLIVEYDDTLSELENEFLMVYMVKDRRKLLKVSKKIARVAARMRKTCDFVESKLNNICEILMNMGEKNSVTRMLEVINMNHVFQPFVSSVLRKMRT